MAVPRTETPSETAPTTVVVGSPEFNDAVAVAVARALAGSSVPVPTAVPAAVSQQPVVIQPTSIDLSEPGLDDLTVQFTRFCTYQNCGYQRGQEAGFPRKSAEDLAKSGSAFIVHDPRRARRAA